MAIGPFCPFRFDGKLLCLATLFQISQHPAQFTAICLTTIAVTTNIKLSTTKFAADELQQKKLPSGLAIDRKWG